LLIVLKSRGDRGLAIEKVEEEGNREDEETED
jgi:hypothetical protein